jgi:hypothetical protein
LKGRVAWIIQVLDVIMRLMMVDGRYLEMYTWHLICILVSKTAKHGKSELGKIV